MSVRPWATFSAASLSPQAEAGGGPDSDLNDVVQAVADLFVGLGADVVVEDAQNDRWTFFIVFRKHRFFCRIVSAAKGFALRLDEIPLWWRASKPALHADLAVKFSDAVGRDSRFQNLLWYTRDHGPSVPPDSSGTRDPLAPGDEPAAATRLLRPAFWRRALRVFGWFALLLAALTVLDPQSTDPWACPIYLVIAAFFLTVGYRVRRVLGVRLPWVRE
jgi:hypothetical protein